jgi:hypothetical protein
MGEPTVEQAYFLHVSVPPLALTGLNLELPVLDLPKLGIAPEHYEAIEKAVKDLGRQGIAIEIKK